MTKPTECDCKIYRSTEHPDFDSIDHCDWHKGLEARYEYQFNENVEARIKLADTKAEVERLKEQNKKLDEVLQELLLKGRGRSGGSVYMVPKDTWDKLKEVT